MTTETDSHLFIRNIARHFEGLPPGSLTMETMFRSVPGWTSLQALVVIISFDEDYGVTVSAEELQRAKTIGDLYDLVMQKQGA